MKNKKVFIDNCDNYPPSEYCLGNRYIHADYGYDSYGIYWIGSLTDIWHGGIRTNDLGKALRWVRKAKYRKLGFWLWGREENEMS